MGKKFGFSWSAKRASGLSAIKGRVSRKIGVPLTRSGRRQKVGRMAGCCVQILAGLILCVIASAPYWLLAFDDDLPLDLGPPLPSLYVDSQADADQAAAIAEIEAAVSQRIRGGSFTGPHFGGSSGQR